MMLQKQKPSFAEEIVELHYSQIYRYCYMKTSNLVTSQDLTQEIFCRFFQRYDDYQREEKIRQILFMIAHNLCIDYYRKEVHKEILIENEDFYGIQKDYDIEKQMSLMKIINQLPFHYKEPLILYYYYDFKIREIAKITKLNVSNVKYRMKMGKVELKKMLEKEGMHYEEWF